MTQVSKYKLSESIKKQIDDFFFETLAVLTTKQQVKNFLEEFFTENERIMFSKRLAIGILLARGLEYREISRVLKVSTSTITNLASRYNNESSYKKIVDKFEDKLQNKKFLLDMAEGVADIGAIGGAKSGGWFKTRNELRKKKNDLL